MTAATIILGCFAIAIFPLIFAAATAPIRRADERRREEKARAEAEFIAEERRKRAEALAEYKREKAAAKREAAAQVKAQKAADEEAKAARRAVKEAEKVQRQRAAYEERKRQREELAAIEERRLAALREVKALETGAPVEAAPAAKPAAGRSDVLKYERVTFTGRCGRLTRQQLTVMAAEHGAAAILERVSPRTTLLVVGVRPGDSTMEQARKMGTRCITWADFSAMLAGAVSEETAPAAPEAAAPETVPETAHETAPETAHEAAPETVTAPAQAAAVEAAPAVVTADPAPIQTAPQPAQTAAESADFVTFEGDCGGHDFNQLAKIARRHGAARILDRVLPATTLLVIGDKPRASVLSAAARLGIQTTTWSQYAAAV